MSSLNCFASWLKWKKIGITSRAFWKWKNFLSLWTDFHHFYFISVMNSSKWWSINKQTYKLIVNYMIHFVPVLVLRNFLLIEQPAEVQDWLAVFQYQATIGLKFFFLTLYMELLNKNFQRYIGKSLGFVLLEKCW